MGKIVINQTDEKQTVILTNDAEGITGVYFGEDGVEKPVGELTVDGLLAGTQPSGDIDYNGSGIVKPGTFWDNTAITSFSAPNAWKVGESCFRGATNLKSVYIGGTPTENTSSLSSYAFADCSSLEEISIPKSNDRFKFEPYSLRGCASLKKIEINDYAVNMNLGSTGLPGNTPLEILIFRGPDAHPIATAALDNSSYFKQGGLGGKLYVPQSLVETYKTTTGWSTYYGYGTMQILPIEGSEYEL